VGRLAGEAAIGKQVGFSQECLKKESGGCKNAEVGVGGEVVLEACPQWKNKKRND